MSYDLCDFCFLYKETGNKGCNYCILKSRLTFDDEFKISEYNRFKTNEIILNNPVEDINEVVEVKEV